MLKDMSEHEEKTWNFYKQWGEEYADKQILSARKEKEAFEYVKKNMDTVPNGSSESRPYGRYRGYVTGKISYKRKDGLPLTELDVEKLKSLSFGQVTGCRSKPGDEIGVVTYTCDSTD